MNKTAKRNADRYLKIVEWSDEDGCYIGSAPPLIGPCCHGDNEAEVFQELSAIVEEWVEALAREGSVLPEATAGKEYSGKFVVRVAPGLHKALALRAMIENRSLNSYCAEALMEHLQPQHPAPEAHGWKQIKKTTAAARPKARQARKR